MEKFLKYVFGTIFFVFAFTPLALGLIDVFLWFLFNSTLLNWDSSRVTFVICWTFLPCPVFFQLFCEVVDS